MNWVLSFLCIAGFFVEYGFSRLTPDFIHPCAVDNNVCMKQSTTDALPLFAKGLPDLGVPSLDPTYIEKLTLPLAGLNISLFKSKVTGFRNAVIDNIESNLAKNKIAIEFHSNVTLKGGYEASGTILTIPINGKGDVKIKIINQKMKLSMNMGIQTDDNGVKHAYIKKYKHTYDFGDRAYFNLTNLFKNDPVLSQTTLQFLNNNWRLIAEEIGTPVTDYVTEISVRTIEKFFLAVPVEELFDGPIPSSFINSS